MIKILQNLGHRFKIFSAALLKMLGNISCYIRTRGNIDRGLLENVPKKRKRKIYYTRLMATRGKSIA